MPDFRLESEAGGRVAGVDEAGRGPLAGPVLAAAVVFPRRVPRGLGPLLDDSKKLTAAEREAAFAALIAAQATGRIEIGVGAASVAEITRLNILRAAMLAMCRAIARLPAPPDLALVDGDTPPPLSCGVRCVIGGDGRSLSIAAASIVAKVLRDRAMRRLAPRYPGFGWDHNAGYGTAAHLAALVRLGPTAHHRPGFAPGRQLRRDLGVINTND
jgi:ribonuclease HII